MGRRRRKARGHYCWSCERVRPNERFSGAGHARHVCRECARLGAGELRFRQAARDLGRLLRGSDLVPRTYRAYFESCYAAELAERDRRAREQLRLERLAEETAERALELENLRDEAGDPGPWAAQEPGPAPSDATEPWGDDEVGQS